MAATFDSDSVDLNGVTAVTVVSAPAAGVKRIVFHVSLYNRDSAAVSPTLRLDTSATDREIDYRSGLAAKGRWVPVDESRKIVLDSTKSLEMVLDGAIAATNPVCHVQWLDLS